MLHMQVDAFGYDNEKCKITRRKICFVEQQQVSVEGFKGLSLVGNIENLNTKLDEFKCDESLRMEI
jgi:hypothetical protein